MRRTLPSSVILACLFLLACGGGTAPDQGPGGSDLPAYPDGVEPDTSTDSTLRPDAPNGDSPATDLPLGDSPQPADIAGPDTPANDALVSPDLPILDAPVLPGCPPCGLGRLTGLACAPDGKSVIPDVVVSVTGTDCRGQPFRVETTSNSLGRYTLEGVPCGYQVVDLVKGSYVHDFDVFVTADETTEQTKGRCFEGTAAKIAVITGDWDSIEETLDALKLKYTLIDGIADDYGSGSEAGNFLSDWSELSQYNILFINCGKSLETGSSGISNLQKFVAQGSSLYASDYGISYIQRAWPGAIILPADAYQIHGQTVTANVRDPRLRGYLQKSFVTLQYVLGPLVAVDAAGPETEVHIEGSFPKLDDKKTRPMMLSFRPNGETGGRVVYTNFHNEEQTGKAAIDLAAILKFIVFML